MTKLETAILAGACFLYACGQPPRENTQAAPLAAYNKTARTAMPPEMPADTFAKTVQIPDTSVKQHEADRYYFPCFDVSWHTRNGPGSFFYDAGVDSLIRSKKPATPTGEMAGEADQLRPRELDRLNAHALLYYCLAYPASYYQNCSPDGSFPLDGKTYICRHLPAPESAREPSSLQLKYVKQQKDSIVLLLQQGLKDSSRIDIEYLALVLEADLRDMIPLLAGKAGFDHNPYIYTLLCCLMEKSGYGPFTRSAFYKKYFIDFTNAGPRGEMAVSQHEADLVVQYALQFYRDTQQWKNLKAGKTKTGI